MCKKWHKKRSGVAKYKNTKSVTRAVKITYKAKQI
jgi:hypothetical protein